MSADLEQQHNDAPRWHYLALAGLVFVLTAVLLALVWQVPRLLPGSFPDWGEPTSAAAPGARPVEPTASPTPSFLQPVITDHSATVDNRAGTITFHLEAVVPSDRTVAEVLLWYDTERGHELERTVGPFSNSTALSYRLDVAQEGLTRTLTATRELDYWWMVRDTSGETARAGGAAILGPSMWSQVTAPTPEPPPIDFTWALSSSHHYQFYYMPGTAAERDRFQIGALAEASLAEIESVLDVELEGRMSIYLVPRIFWQGGAAYGDKVQLISYLDRNYAAIETWTYFTHEGTHALAQDLLQPKENGGGPDGVLVEGLAVWASDGHYRREPLDAWAAVVAGSDQYLPLADLRAGPFYDFQHETSYLEGASFVKFLVDNYGLEKLKELYGRATGDAEHDGALVQSLYGKGYDVLEAEWLAHLEGLSPTPEQAEMWRLKVRAFDLMRRYETELDPDARLLPSTAPPEWTSDTLKVFMGRVGAPVNLVLETALIASQERIHAGDRAGAAALLDDVEAALDAGGLLTRPSLRARGDILEMIAAQDRSILRADADGYRDTLDPASGLGRDSVLEQVLRPPFTAYRQEVVRLDMAGDGHSAHGAVLLHAQVADGEFPDDGRLFALTVIKVGGRWLVSSREPLEPHLALPPAAAD
ncbi:MAG: hypothetical protein PVI80_08970 [Anaerolineae bacterium]|jgi:hypothetical protein